MAFEEIPIFIALALSLIGMASPVWKNLHRAMFCIYSVIIVFTQFYFKPPAIPLGFLPYAGAILSGAACVYLGLFTNIYPKNIDHKQGVILSIAGISLLLLFIFEMSASWLDGYIYGHISQEHYLLYQYRPFMLCLTTLQSIILLAGGIDGGKRIISVVGDRLTSYARPSRSSPDVAQRNEKFQQRNL